MNEQHGLQSGADGSASAQHGCLAAVAGICGFFASVAPLDDNGGRYWSAITLGIIAFIAAMGHVAIVRYHRRPVQRWVRVGTGVCLMGLFALVPVCLLPVFIVEFSGWQRLHASLEEIVVPGDGVRVWVDGPEPPTSCYRATISNATVISTDELVGGPSALRAGILRDPRSSDGTSQRRYLISISIPDEPGWVGKTVTLRVDLKAEDTDKQGSGWKVTGAATLDIPVAPPGAGVIYRRSWRVAFFGGALSSVLLGFVLGGLAGTPRPTTSSVPVATASHVVPSRII